MGRFGGPCTPPPPPPPPLSISKPKKVQEYQSETSEVLLFTDAEKLYEPKISQFSPCMLQFLDNIQRLFIFSNYTGEKDHFSLDFLEIFDT